MITLIKFLIREITGDANADIWIAEDEDYIVKLVTLPGIVPNRRNDRERSNSMYHLHDQTPADLITNSTQKKNNFQRSATAASLPGILILYRVTSWRRSVDLEFTPTGLNLAPKRIR